MIAADHVEVVDEFASIGVYAATTTRRFGTVASSSDEPAHVVAARWDAIRALAADHGAARLATASQVHGARVLVYDGGWDGWLRGSEADGHLTRVRGTALGVTVADCVPVFLAHASGTVALLHSGWRGTVARIVEKGIDAFVALGLKAADLRLHLGPAICGKCYEVSADVAKQLTGEASSGPRTVDLRALIAEHARAKGVTRVSSSPHCTKCDNDRFFSHRAGDVGRQLALIVAKS